MTPKEIFKKFEQLNILIVGDVMLDEYIFGNANRISPEAPVPVVLYEKADVRLGGAANVALNVKALGGTPLLLTVVGNDSAGQKLKKLLSQLDISNDYVIESADSTRPTTVKQRILAGTQQLLRLDTEVSTDVTDEDSEVLYETFSKILEANTVQVILFQDYNKGVLTEHFIQKCIAQANQKGIATAVDPKLKNFFAYQNVTLFKPNLKEVRDGLGISVVPEMSSLRAASQAIRRQLNHKITLITLSERGLYADENDVGNIVPTSHLRNIADVCGAGDTVISVAAMCVGLSLGIEQIAQLSNLAGGQVCEKVGVVSVNKQQLLEEYERFLDLK